jgi:competence protein ComEC
MASAPPTPLGLPGAPAPGGDDALHASVWRAPLVHAALAVTAGIVLDRYAAVPLGASLAVAAVCLVAWACARTASRRGLPLAYLALAGVAAGAAYHHYRRDVYPADDIGHSATPEPRTAQLRGVLDEEPFWIPAEPAGPLRSMEQGGSTASVLRVTHLHRHAGWVEASGKVRLVVAGRVPGPHAGDEVEVVGQLSSILGPANPGEFDRAAYWRDQGVRARMNVKKTPGGVTRLARRWPESVNGWLAVTRGWGEGVLDRALPRRSSGLAMALILGDEKALADAAWEKYKRTGVIHVLAVSGQHLVVLAMFLWWGLRLAGVRQRHGAWVVAVVLLSYALLTGGRPPAMRAAVMVCAACGGMILRRRTLPANLFALAWLAVALLNPCDLFGYGCQLSFLSVAVLLWGTRRLFHKEYEPLEAVIEESRPAWQRRLRRLVWVVCESYAVTAIIWLSITPLAASRSHVVPQIGLALGPPLTLLASIALLSGFVLLMAGAVCWPLTGVLAPVVDYCLAASEALVDNTDNWPLAHRYVGDIPEWWLWILYLGLLAVLTQGPLRRRWRWGLTAGLGWLCVGLLAGAARLPADELRCTFLAVGHGGCTVLETPDGRTLLYDAGSLAGPDVARRQIAPFLWSRGVRRVDEVILSHADLDHFNGLVELLDRFAVGQVTCTPTFADKDTPGVRHTLAVLQRRGIPVRIAKAGDRLTAGAVTLDVLHPPARGPDGNENARSLVLQVRHAGHTLLLTGDLEGPGLARVLGLPRRPVDVLQAPHHGSPAANKPELAAWAGARVVVSCQGRPRRPGPPKEPYTARGAHWLATWPDGAVTVRSHESGLVVETFTTGQRLVLRAEAPPAN